MAEAQVAKAKAAQKKHDADAARFARLKAEDRVSDNEAEQVELLREREQLLREQPGYRRLVFGLSLTVTGMIGILLI